MSGSIVRVTAEWARWGIDPEDWSYGLLECSDGSISREAITEALLQIFLYPSEDLPQVTFGGFRQESTGTYLGVAIQEPGQRDHAGRETTMTSCYFVPFHQLATGLASYKSIYESFRRLRLASIGDRRPVAVELAEPQVRLPPNQLSLSVATLLLTHARVCISGARHLPLDERLRFFDDVTAMLPYAMRSRIGACTSVDRIRSDKRYPQLFFSDYPLDNIGLADITTVSLNKPSDIPLRSEAARRYLELLSHDAAGYAAELAQMRDPQRFSRISIEDLTGLLAELGQSQVVKSRPTRPVQDSPQGGPAYPAQTPVAQFSQRFMQVTIRSAIRHGLLLFNPPDEMRQGHKDRIEVGIAQSTKLREALLEGLRGHGTPQFEEIDTSSFMSVELKGDSFQITSYSAPIQMVAPTARWEFDVLPSRVGMQTLMLCVCLVVAASRFKAYGNGYRSIPVLERKIRIRVDVAYSVRRFLSSNWQWLIATAAGFGGGMAAWIALFH